MGTTTSTFDKAVVLKITLYFVLAFGISYGFHLLPSLLALPGMKWLFTVGFGPFLSTIVVSYWSKTPLSLRLFSKTSWVRTMEVTGLVVFLVGTLLTNILSGKTDYYLIIFWTLYALFYALLEELGWRVFLGNELSKYSLFTTVLVSGVLWFAWHYSFANRLTMEHPLRFLAMIVGGSAGLAEFYRKTKSWLIVGMAHALVNVNPPSLPILLIFLAVTIGFLKFHEYKNKQAAVTRMPCEPE
ncbi:CPBP family intramembrane metalloprotease [Spirosoma sp. BT704]|uniref:CPBP family intramembrane metalloprotease n=2 Tax=Spirosoma validum TaxID=2771355 RepID=A0A927GHK5_9BACT|nr:CPBP family intramembrane metalloprotease [Spirosoma validum]